MKAYIGIGSNIGNRRMYINKAVAMLGPQLKRVSSIYETESVGINAGGKFLNAAAEIETGMKPLELLEFLEDIERKLGRKEKANYKSRTIDLDILFYGAESIDTPRLKIPHPRIAERPFVLKPLLELNPEPFLLKKAGQRER